MVIGICGEDQRGQSSQATVQVLVYSHLWTRGHCSPATVQVYSHLWTRGHYSQATVQVYSHLWTRGPLFSSYSPGILASVDQVATTVLQLQSRYTRIYGLEGATVLQLQSRYTRIYRPGGHCSTATVQQVYSHLWTRETLFSSYSPGILASLDY